MTLTNNTVGVSNTVVANISKTAYQPSSASGRTVIEATSRPGIDVAWQIYP